MKAVFLYSDGSMAYILFGANNEKTYKKMAGLKGETIITTLRGC